MRIPFTLPPAETRPFDVVGYGLNSVDLIAVVAGHPSSNSKHRLQQFVRLPGGQTSTAILACARLGWRSRYVGTFGDDELGEIAREPLLREGIDIHFSRVVPGAKNQFAVVIVDASTGGRTVLWDRDPLLTIDLRSLPPAAVTSGRVFLVDCHDETAAHAARWARAANVLTVLDVEEARPGLPDLLSNVDVIIAAEEFPGAFTGESELGVALRALAREYRSLMVAVTLGDQGSLAWCGGKEFRTPAFSVPCVDTTGAGDAFRAGFAAACLKNPRAEIEDVLRYANAVAALNCRALGAQDGLPAAREVEGLLAR